MQLALAVLPILAQLGVSNPLPQTVSASCSTSTVEVIIPTTTVTYTTTPISTIYASTAEDLGTFTETVRIPSTSTVATVTSTDSACGGYATGVARYESTRFLLRPVESNQTNVSIIKVLLLLSTQQPERHPGSAML